MKYAAVFFVLCFVALAAAAPQLLTTWPGLAGTGVLPWGGVSPWGARTLVAGPTVVNGVGYPGRIITPGVYGPTFI